MATSELAKILWYYNLIPDVATSQQKIICPLHKDVNPSMIINLDNDSWYCFGCGKSGTALSFVKEMEVINGLNDLQACKKFYQILKSDKCSKIKYKPNKKAPKRTNKELYDIAYDYYHCLGKINWCEPSAITEVSESIEYMKKRGFSPSTLNKCKAKVTYNKSYGIIFPMLDNGKFKGWVCRTMIKSIEEHRKYLYNEGFSRATTLVGNYGSKDYVFVVEGYMDRLKFVQYGVDNVVAILGWKMSDQQIQKLKDKGITKVISALDNDPCGKKGTEYLKKHFEVIRFSYLKGVKDPGEMNKVNFKKMLNKTMRKIKGE